MHGSAPEPTTGVHWRIADGVAWVGDEDRVALIDTRSSSAAPMLVPPVFGELWRLLSDGPRPESDLQAKGAELVDESGPDLIQAFVDAMSQHDLIESVDSAA